MYEAGHMYSGAAVYQRYKVGATIANPGVAGINEASILGGIIPSTATDMEDSPGLMIETATYSATPASGATGIVTVSRRPDLILGALYAGSSTEGTALTIMTNTAADLSAPDTVTSADAQGNDMTGGTCWRLQGLGEEAGLLDQGEIIVHTTSTLVTVIPDFEQGIALNDQFLMIPQSKYPSGAVATLDGESNLNLTAAFFEMDATVASGTGEENSVWRLRLRSAADSAVEFINQNHRQLAIN